MSAEMPLIDIHPDHWKIVQRILQEHVPDLEVWAFGSRANGSAKEYSDLDLAVITDEPLPLDTRAALSKAFSESDLPWKVDVENWASVGESFQGGISIWKVAIQNRVRVVRASCEWRSCTLGDLVDFSNGKASPVRCGGGGVPVFGSNGQIGESGISNSPENTIIIGRVGSYCGSVFISKTPSWVTENAIRAIARDENDARFVFYLIKTLRLNDRRAGSGQPLLNQSILSMIDARVPRIEVQRAIAHILGTLDDRIELNRKQNETLEEMARAMFKAWFVDFEPVRAKMEGRWKRGQSLPGMPAHLYDLFPDRMVESELGEIPEGWEVRSLDSIANYLNGLALQKYPPESEDEFLPVIKIAQLRSGDTHGAGRASARISPEYVVENGDVLFSWSGSLEVEVWSGGRGALNQHLFKVTSGLFPKWFYYFATRHHLPTFREIAAGKATTMGHIQRKHLTASKVVIPSMEGMNRIDSVIAPLFEKLTYNAKQSRLLVQLRDSLLPDLVSGDLRVRNPGRLLENMRRL